MTPSDAHYFDTNEMEWRGHEAFPAILIKTLESRATHPTAAFSMMRVRLVVASVIDTHVHELETETVYIVAGQGVLTLGDDKVQLAAGTGISIPPGVPHSLHNVGEVMVELIAIHTPPVR